MNTLYVHGMTCNHCVQAVSDAVKTVAGTANVIVELDAGTVTWDGSDVEPVLAAIQNIGFEATKERLNRL